MTIDRYTKGVLTVIAACLLWLCAMQAPGTALAQQTAREIGPWSQHVQPVVLVGVGAMNHDGKVVVYFTPHNGVQWTDPTVPVQLPYSPDHPLPVGLPYSPSNPLPTHLALVTGPAMPVEITAVRKSGDWEPFRVEVEPAPGRGKPGGGGNR
jgi:hypothetical protein